MQTFLKIKFTPKNANFCQFFANFCQFTPKFAPKNANFCQFLPIFRIKSVKIYIGQKKFTRLPPVAPVTNMRYGVQYVNILNIRSDWWQISKKASVSVKRPERYKKSQKSITTSIIGLICNLENYRQFLILVER